MSKKFMFIVRPNEGKRRSRMLPEEKKRMEEFAVLFYYLHNSVLFSRASSCGCEKEVYVERKKILPLELIHG